MIDLHLHLDGSLTPENIIKLAKMQEIALPYNTPSELLPHLVCPDDCKNLQEYLSCFDLPLSVLQTGEAVEEAVFMLCERLKSEGILYAEIRFAPSLHTKNGCSQKEIVEAARHGLFRSDFNANLILCLMRGAEIEKNIETISVAEEFIGKGVVALDLAGAESLYKTHEYADLFELAQKLCIPFIIHAGEADGAQSVRDALAMGARRIGHGVHAAEDKELLSLLIKEQIPIEMCVTSNCQTKAVDKIQNHPIKKFLDLGICVTVNTDNMTVSDTTIKKEFELIKKYFGITEKEKELLLTNAVNAAFLSDNEKNNLIQKISNV